MISSKFISACICSCIRNPSKKKKNIIAWELINPCTDSVHIYGRKEWIIMHFWPSCRKNICFSFCPGFQSTLYVKIHILSEQRICLLVSAKLSLAPSSAFSCHPLSIPAAGCRAWRKRILFFRWDNKGTAPAQLTRRQKPQGGVPSSLSFSIRGKAFSKWQKKFIQPTTHVLTLLISRTPAVRPPPLQITLHCWLWGWEVERPLITPFLQSLVLWLFQGGMEWCWHPPLKWRHSSEVPSPFLSPQNPLLSGDALFWLSIAM